MHDGPRAAIVTGGGGGIGRATSLRLGASGMAVLIVDLDRKCGAETVAAITAAGGQASFFEADVTDPVAVKAYVDECESLYGGVDAFLNNAAYVGLDASIPEYDLDDFQKVFSINVLGVFLGLRNVLPAMRKRGGGAIVNMSSRGGVRGLPNQSVYSASKHAVIGLSRSAALEAAGDGIRINAICPGPTNTPMMGDPARFLHRVPVGRVAEADEVAALAAWLLSESPGFMTGTVLLIDGGMTAV